MKLKWKPVADVAPPQGDLTIEMIALFLKLLPYTILLHYLNQNLKISFWFSYLNCDGSLQSSTFGLLVLSSSLVWATLIGDSFSAMLRLIWLIVCSVENISWSV